MLLQQIDELLLQDDDVMGLAAVLIIAMVDDLLSFNRHRLRSASNSIIALDFALIAFRGKSMWSTAWPM